MAAVGPTLGQLAAAPPQPATRAHDRSLAGDRGDGASPTLHASAVRLQPPGGASAGLLARQRARVRELVWRGGRAEVLEGAGGESDGRCATSLDWQS